MGWLENVAGCGQLYAGHEYKHVLIYKTGKTTHLRACLVPVLLYPIVYAGVFSYKTGKTGKTGFLLSRRKKIVGGPPPFF